MRALLVAAVVFSSPSQPASVPAEEGPGVILLIGDGFGAAQMAFGVAYARVVEGRELHLERLMKHGNTGYSLPLSHDSVVIDSAAAATQIATGRRVRNETLGLSAEGHPIETILEWAEGAGLATGLVTNMRLSHATPAGFAAHRASRYDAEPDILDEMFGGHDVEVMLGGGARALVPRGRRVSELLPAIRPELDDASNRRDDRDVLAEARARGYAVVADRESLARESKEAAKLLGLFSATHLPYVLDRRHLALDQVPTLAEMTEAALGVLRRSPKGFFLVVEGGRIDYAGHDNDAGTLIHEILDFDEALGEGLGFQERHPETLVLVTADHGTGGFSFTFGDFAAADEVELPSGLRLRPTHLYPTRAHLETLAGQRASYKRILELAGDSPERLVEVVEGLTGLGMTLDEARAALVRDAEGKAWTLDFRHFYGDEENNPACLLARALARHTFVVWSTGGHTTDPVLTFGSGPGAEALRGVYENTHLYGVMTTVLGGGSR